MEITVRQDLQTSPPLGSTSPRRVNTSSANSTTAVNQEDAKEQAKIEEQIRQEEARIIQQLSARDREVRAHEQAHANVAGQYVVSGPSYTYQRGPDGQNYAIGGQVQLDTSPVPGDPEATLRKAEVVRRAALAPAEPSPQDVRVAASATQTAAQARVEIAVQRREEAELEKEEQVEAAEESEQIENTEETNPVNAAENSEVEGESTEANNPVAAPASPTETNAPATAARGNTSVLQAFAIEEPAEAIFSQFA